MCNVKGVTLKCPFRLHPLSTSAPLSFPASSGSLLQLLYEFAVHHSPSLINPLYTLYTAP